jgi:large subunit ribosomal protein L10
MASAASTQRHPPPHHHQPPSYRRPEARRSQLLRQYTSLIRTSPLMVLFQHNNLRSVEWTAIRRELTQALRKVDEQQAPEGRLGRPFLSSHAKLQIVQTNVFEVALRIVEYFRPERKAPAAAGRQLQDADNLAATVAHDLSRTAHDAVIRMKGKHELSALLVGPLMVLSFPYVSPEHLKAALSILAPKTIGFPAPTRRASPSYRESTVQDGLQKLMFLAARVDGRVLDTEETKWVGGIDGGMDGLRSQLVMALQSMGASITNALEGAGKSLYLTLESRRSVLEEEEEPNSQGKKS